MSNRENRNSGFMMGLMLGAIAAAVSAVVIYRQKDTEVFKKYKMLLQDYLKSFFEPVKSTPSKKAKTKKKTHKKVVILPSNKKFFKKA